VTEQHVWMASVSALPIFPKCCFQGRVAALLFDAFCSTDQDLVESHRIPYHYFDSRSFCLEKVYESIACELNRSLVTLAKSLRNRWLSKSQ
jgi:hypothetical protein